MPLSRSSTFNTVPFFIFHVHVLSFKKKNMWPLLWTAPTFKRSWPTFEAFHPLQKTTSSSLWVKGRQGTVQQRQAQRETIRSLHQSKSPLRLIPTGRATLFLRRKMQLTVDLIALSWRMRACWVIESSTRKIMIDEQQEGLTSHFTHWLLRQDRGRGKKSSEIEG